MNLLIDMNLSQRWASVLVGAGFETVHWSAIGRNNATDAEIVAFAKANGTLSSHTIWTLVRSLLQHTARNRASFRSAPTMSAWM